MVKLPYTGNVYNTKGKIIVKHWFKSKLRGKIGTTL